MRIIHVEDDEVIAEFVQILCADHEHVWASNTTDAKALALRQPFDLALIDLGLQGGDSGLHFLQWLAENQPQTYRVLVSGVTTLGMVNLLSMADACLDKPFTAQQFEVALASACAKVSVAQKNGKRGNPSSSEQLR